MTIDENLTWKSHIDNISKNISKGLGIINKLKLFVPEHVLYSLYCTLILPYVNYSIIAHPPQFRTMIENVLVEEQGILSRWTEYCSALYNYELDGDPTVLDCPQSYSDDEENHPILSEEVGAAVKALKKGTSPGVDNVPAELVQAAGEAAIDMLTKICNKIWQTGTVRVKEDKIFFQSKKFCL